MANNNSPDQKISYVSDENGEVVAVQIGIKHFQKMIRELSDSRTEESMEDAIREIYEIERGTLPKISLTDFLDEI